MTAKKFGKFHAVMVLIWILLIIPSLIWWKDSVLWVIVISIYANIVGHFASYQATRAEESNK